MAKQPGSFHDNIESKARPARKARRLGIPLSIKENGLPNDCYDHYALRKAQEKVQELHSRGNIINVVFTVDTIIMPYGRRKKRCRSYIHGGTLYMQCSRLTRSLCPTEGARKGAGVTYTSDYYKGSTHVPSESRVNIWCTGLPFAYVLV
ncbi:hypothetical protein J6590_006740 [Homalodisca vitripennis]|nr:hypothetical protein J6590_006740 [Homalodisca vitripennis]